MGKRKKVRRPLPQRRAGKSSPSLAEQFAANPNWVALGVFIFLAAIFFADVLFGGKIFFAPDMQGPAALSMALKEALWKHGTYPLWSPFVFAGMPSFASLFYTPFAYLPYIPFELLEHVVRLPYLLPHILHFPVAGMGVYLFLRDRHVAVLPAIFAGIAFMFTPYLITMEAFGHGSQMMTAVYMPLALWAVDRLLRQGGWLHTGIAALVLGLQFQRAHVQVVYYTWMLLGAYFLYFMAQRFRDGARKELLSTTGRFALVFLLALGMAAMLYLPIYEYMPYSIRGTAAALASSAGQPGVGFEYATQWSFSLGEMMTFLLPAFYGFGGQTYWGTMPFTDYPNYMGILVLLFALFAVAYKRQHPVGFFAVIALLALLISFGKHFAFLYKLLYNYLPFFNRFRVPVMILIVVQMCVALLAGFGLQKMLDFIHEKPDAKIARRVLLAAGFVLGLAVVLTLARSGFFNLMRGLYPDQYAENIQLSLDLQRFDLLFSDVWRISLWVAAGLALLSLAIRDPLKSQVFALAILVMSVADLWFVDYKLNKPASAALLENYLAKDQLSNFLSADTSLYRIFPVAGLFGENRWAAHGIESIGGYHAAKPRVYQDFLDATRLDRDYAQKYVRVVNRNGQQALASTALETIDPVRRQIDQRLIDFLNVKYVLSPYPIPEPAFQSRGQMRFYINNQPVRLQIYENTQALPRAVLVGEYQKVASARAALSLLNSEQFDPRRRVILYEDPQRAPLPDSTAQANMRHHGLQQMVVATRAAQPQLLVISDTYYPPGWRAAVDGQPARILQANHAFRAIEVPAGEHEVVLTYHSRRFTLGVWLSILSTLAVAGCIFWGLRGKKAPVLDQSQPV